MNSLASGCLSLLAQWAGFSFLLWDFLLSQRFSPPGDSIGAVIGGFLLVLAIGTFRNGLKRYRDARSLIRAGEVHGLPRKDGLVAVSGVISSRSNPLRSPFGDVSCALFEYDVFEEREFERNDGPNTKTRKPLLSGYAMAAPVIRNAFGDIALMSFPLLTEYAVSRFQVVSHSAELEAFRKSKEFEKVEGLGVKTLLGKLKEIFSQTNGNADVHLRFLDEPELSKRLRSSDSYIEEKALSVGEPVCAIGQYSLAHGGFIQTIKDGGLQLFPGKPEKVIASLKRRAVAAFIGAPLLLLFGLGGPYGVLMLREGGSSVSSERDRELVDAVRNDDIGEIRRLSALQRFSKQETMYRKTLLSRVRSPEAAKILLEQGYPTEEFDQYGYAPVHYAVSQNNIDVLQALLDARVDPNLETQKWRRTALDIAISKSEIPILRLLRAYDGRATILANDTGIPVAEGGENFFEVVREFYEACKAKDKSKIFSLVDDWPDEYFEHVVSGDWENAKPVDITFVSGRKQVSVATLAVQGMTKSGHSEIWLYTLVQKNNRWLIRFEDFDENELWSQPWER